MRTIPIFDDPAELEAALARWTFHQVRALGPDLLFQLLAIAVTGMAVLDGVPKTQTVLRNFIHEIETRQFDYETMARIKKALGGPKDAA